MSTSSQMTLYDILRRGAALAPDQIAITHGDRQITYRDLMASTADLIRRLKDRRMKSGARIGLLWENSIEYVTAFFAITGAGYVVVPLDSSLKPDKVAYILNDCRARGLVIQGKMARNIDEVLPADSSVELLASDVELSPALDVTVMGINDKPALKPETFRELIEGIADAVPMDGLNHRTQPDYPDDLAAIFYTSGSTGTSKGVMLSHRNLISNTVATVEYLELTGDDSIILILPFYYIYGNSLMLTHLLVGGRLVIDNRFAFPQVILKTMADQKVTGFSGVPSNFMFLLGKKGFDSTSLPALRYLTQAGGALAPDVIRRVMTTFPDKKIFIMYGQTEASPRVSWLPPDRLAEKLGSIGIPVPGVTMELVDEAGRACPDETVGEITVSGDNVMLGYWNQPAEQAEVLSGGRLFTGDLARRDADGYFWVVSRKKEIIKVGGNRVSAREVEECLLEHDAVREAAVISVDDDIMGEAIKAFVVTRDSAKAAASDLQNHCRINLPIHKVPKHIEFIDALPKHHSGKIDKLALSQL